MFNSLGLWLIKRREYAIGIVFACALLTLAGVPATWLGLLVIGLVTLSKGAREGFLVVMWMVLPGIALAIVQSPPFWLLAAVLVKAILVWGLAQLLRRSGSWSVVLQAASIVGGLSILALHVTMPDLAAWWVKQLSPIWQTALQTLDLHYNPAQSQQLLVEVAQYATGTIVAIVLAIDIVLLLIARAWQCSILSPGTLGGEFYRIRMNYVAGAILLICAVAAGFGVQLALDLLPVLLLPFVFAALSIIHGLLANKKQYKAPLLVCLYMMLIVFLPYIAVLLAFIGLVDSCYSLRAWGSKKAQAV